ncbi:MAG: DUF4097 family beta strand repeat-containing protein [Acutalibacter sp.]|jgi:hypothetical protein
MNQKKKRFFKIGALAGCILLGAGILMSGAGYLAMGMSLNAFTHPRGGAATPVTVCHPVDAIDAIEVHASIGNVTIQGSSSKIAQEVEIQAADSVYQVYEQNGILMVLPVDTNTATGQRDWKWFQLFNLYPEGDWDVVITVPEKLLSSVYVEAGLGNTTLTDLNAEKATVESDSGNVKLEEVSASKEMTVTQSMGDVDLEDCTGKDLTLENDMGAVTVSGCDFGQSWVTNRSGNVTLTDSTFDSLTAETDMGDCTLNQVDVNGPVECTTSMGNVELDVLSSLDITLSADSGNITGTIQGSWEEYQISADTDAGDCNLRDQVTDGPGRLLVTTGMGDINLKFTS